VPKFPKYVAISPSIFISNPKRKDVNTIPNWDPNIWFHQLDIKFTPPKLGDIDNKSKNGKAITNNIVKIWKTIWTRAITIITNILNIFTIDIRSAGSILPEPAFSLNSSGFSSFNLSIYSCLSLDSFFKLKILFTISSLFSSELYFPSNSSSNQGVWTKLAHNSPDIWPILFSVVSLSLIETIESAPILFDKVVIPETISAEYLVAIPIIAIVSIIYPNLLNNCPMLFLKKDIAI